MEKIYARRAAKRISRSRFRRNAETPERTAARLSARRDRDRRRRSAATPEQITARRTAEHNRSRLSRSAAVVVVYYWWPCAIFSDWLGFVT